MTKPSSVVKAYIDPFTGIVYADEGLSSALNPIGFVISSGTRVNGALLHSSLTGLTSDDHTQYALVDASRAFTDLPFTTFTGIPTQPGDLITKAFLDTVVVSGVAGVVSLNSLTGNINVVGSGIVNVTTAGNDIFINAAVTPNNALVGAGTVTVISGSNVTTVSGAASTVAHSLRIVSSFPPSPSAGDVVFLTTTRQSCCFDGIDWTILG